jgi:hypothetical protein
VFQGCRAWDNADDGWDFYNNQNNVTLIDCWAMRNGYDHWGVGAGWSGNGNGFKLGVGTGRHALTNCIAFGNRSKGFDHNHSTAGQTVVNSTGYSNNVNFSFYETPAIGQNLLINNLAFSGTATNLDPTTITVSNSWQVGGAAGADFASLDSSLALLPRHPDYTLQTNAFLRLAPGSSLIDRGIDVGLPCNGAAPDLGAFEFVSATAPPRTITLSASAWSNGGFQFTASGLTAHGAIEVSASTNLSTWTPIFTNLPVSGAWQFTDSNAVAHPQRLYRAVEK